MPLTDIKQIGPEYDFGISSPTYGLFGGFVKANTFRKDLQTQLRDDVIAGLTIAVGDRDLAFWKRQSQNDWSQGEGQTYFSNPSRYDKSSSLDVHMPGQLRLVPQPTQLLAATGALNGRGAAYCKQKVFFPWVDGKYCWVDNTLTVNQATTPAAAVIADIVSDGSTVFFALASGAGVWQTPAAAPVGLAQYDAPGSFYSRLVYDQVKKLLYASTAPITGSCILHKINAGGAATVIYDFLTGRIDALEMYQGNVIIGWNDAFGPLGSAGQVGRGRLFKYDGTSVTTLADFPDGLMVIGMKSFLGVLFVLVSEQDPLDPQNAPPAAVLAEYAISGSTVTRIGTVKSGQVHEIGGGWLINNGSMGMALGVGQHLFVPTAGHVWRYDTVLGGLSRSLGDDGVPGLNNVFSAAIMSGLGLLSGGGVVCELGGGAATGGIYNLNGTIFGIKPSFPGQGTAKLTGSRMDAGLPYVGKFWYAFEAIFTPLLASESIEMERSLDDGASWAACTGSPFSTLGANQFAFLIQQTNPHVRYRVRPVANPGVTAGPTLFSVSAKYAVLNPNASVYRMTVSCVDTIRGRGNAVDQPGYGKDALTFFDNIAHKNELVTFYEPDDSTRTPHTCWVMSMSSPRNTGSIYDPKKAEGEVELVLWETV